MKLYSLIAVLALLAVGLFATAAQASAPAFFECVKVKTGGEYKNSTCTEGGQHGLGHFELKEGIGKKTAFKGLDGHMELTYPGSEPAEPEYIVDCGTQAGKPGHVTGELTSTTTIGHVIVTGGNCEAGCTNAPKGKVELGPLEGTLGYLDKETGKVGIDFAGEGGKPIASFGCSGGEQIVGSMVAQWGTDLNGFEQHALVGFEGGFESLEGGELDVPTLHMTATGEEQPVTVKRLMLTLIMPKGIQVRTH